MNIQEFSRSVFFNFRYLGNPTWDTGIPAPELMEYIFQNSPARALDLGCGTGTNVKALLQAGWVADGVDIALLAILAARRKISPFRKQGKVFLGSVTELTFLTEKYDLILDIGCFHALSSNERQGYIWNVKQLSKTNGTLLMYAFLKDDSRRIGINSSDIAGFEKDFILVNRKIGVDRHERPSAWLEYKKKDKPE